MNELIGRTTTERSAGRPAGDGAPCAAHASPEVGRRRLPVTSLPPASAGRRPDAGAGGIHGRRRRAVRAPCARGGGGRRRTRPTVARHLGAARGPRGGLLEIDDARGLRGGEGTLRLSPGRARGRLGGGKGEYTVDTPVKASAAQRCSDLGMKGFLISFSSLPTKISVINSLWSHLCLKDEAKVRFNKY